MKKRILNFLLTSSLLFSICVAQPQPSEDPVQVMSEAYELFLNGNKPEGLSVFKDIAERYRGTEAGYLALDFLANNARIDDSAMYLQQIIADFPDTIYETEARTDLLALEFDMNHRDKATFLQGCGQIVQELGGPSLEEIVNAPNSVELSNQIRALGENKQRRLLKVYPYMGSMLGRKFPDIPGDEADRVSEMRMLQFLHRVFTPLELGYDGLLPIYWSLPTEVLNSIPDRKTFLDPAVTFESPDPGSVTGPRPRVTATLVSGDFTVQTISLENIVASLDGQDVSSQLTYQTTFGVPETGVPFLTINLSYQTASPLTDGPHQFVLEVPVEKYPGEGPGRTVAILDFVVQSDNNNEPVELSTTKDTILSQRHPHQNEGANTLLTLEKIQGKATRSAVAFDLAGTNLTGLTKATLVLTVDPSEGVNGWGNGGTITARSIISSWQEGNGAGFGLRNKDKHAGNGSGATWFSPIDENISNDSANSAANWNGAANSAPPTAPGVLIKNSYTGEVQFDVTNDILNGSAQGWLISKDRENIGSKISFFSREGAAVAGDPSLAPRLLLEFGSLAGNGVQSQPDQESVLAALGIGYNGLRPELNRGELFSIREVLQKNSVLALATEQLINEATRANPVISLTSRAAYRSWLDDDIRLASLSRSKA